MGGEGVKGWKGGYQIRGPGKKRGLRRDCVDVDGGGQENEK